jgi:hypothetical protein
MSQEAKDYVEAETKFFPVHFSQKEKDLIRFMILEAFNAGMNRGFDKGMIRECEIAADIAADRLQQLKNRQSNKK